MRPVLAGAAVVHRTTRTTSPNRPTGTTPAKKTSKGDRRTGDGRCEHHHPSGRRCAFGCTPGQRYCHEHLHGAILCSAQTPDGPCEHRIQGREDECPEHGKSAAKARAHQQFVESTKRNGAGGLKGEAKRRHLAEERKKRERAELARCKPSRRVAKAVYKGVPVWNGREHWKWQGEALFSQWKDYLVHICGLPSLGAATFFAYLAVVAEAANHRTGRNVRVGRKEIGRRMAERLGAPKALSPGTVSLCRRYATVLGLLTVIAEGSERTSAERQSTWRAKDKSHGWAPLLALHPSLTVAWPDKPAEPVDNHVENPQLEAENITYPRSGQVLEEPPFREVVPFSNQNHASRDSGENAGASRRGHEKGGPPRPRKRREWDPRTVALEAEVRLDPEMPRFVQNTTPGELRAALDRYAKHDWTRLDVREGIRFFLKRHPKKWHDQPHRPARFLWWVLDQSGIRLAGPPSRTRHLKDAGPAVDALLAKSRETRDRGEAFLAANRALTTRPTTRHTPAAPRKTIPAITGQESQVGPPAALTEAPERDAAAFEPQQSDERRSQIIAENGSGRFLSRLRPGRDSGENAV